MYNTLHIVYILVCCSVIYMYIVWGSSGRLMKSVLASIYFLSQRCFAHVATEKVIDDRRQEYNGNDAMCRLRCNDDTKRRWQNQAASSGAFLSNFSPDLNLSIQRGGERRRRGGGMPGHKPKRQEPSDLHQLYSVHNFECIWCGIILRS